MSTAIRIEALAFAAALAMPLQAQHSRVTFNGSPTNLQADLSTVLFAPHPTVSNGFYVLMPLTDVLGSSGGPFVFDGGAWMDSQYGAGNWSRCTMRAEEWSYFSSNRCIHRPAPGIQAPHSLLTTDYDYGPGYSGIAGVPDPQIPGWTRFASSTGNTQTAISGSWVSGLGTPANERWQLRVRGWSPSNLWNNCPGGSVVPTVPGWIAVYFTVGFLPVAPRLSGLVLSEGVLDPPFDPDTTAYNVALGGLIPELTVTPSSTATGATIAVDGTPVASGQSSAPIAMAPGANNVTVQISTPQGGIRAYTLAINRGFVEEAAIYNPIFTDFGDDVAIDGDTAVVGASASGGRVHVYTRTRASWTLQQTLSPSTGGFVNDRYGRDVAISGDTVVVGAPELSVGPIPSHVFVYTRSGTTWTEQAVLLPPGTTRRFGSSVAIDGDTLVIGGDSDEVYVFTRSGSTWTQRATITGSNTQAGDMFGGGGSSPGRGSRCIALQGDTIVVGAYAEDSSSSGVNSTPNENATDSGAIYVFTGSGANWVQQAYVKASNPGANDAFGANLSLDGDTLVVGAAHEDSNTTGVNSFPNDLASDSGAAYVFVRNGSTWSQQAYLKAFNTDWYDEFGESVAVSGDTIVVGATGERTGAPGINPVPDENGIHGGAVYLFRRVGGVWNQTTFVKPSDTQNRGASFFGHAVAIDAATFVVGAVFGDAVYMFR